MSARLTWTTDDDGDTDSGTSSREGRWPRAIDDLITKDGNWPGYRPPQVFMLTWQGRTRKAVADRLGKLHYHDEQEGARADPRGGEVPPFAQVGNEFASRKLKRLPAVFKGIWLNMLIYANGRKGRIVRKVSQAWLAEETGYHRMVVGQAFRCLLAIPVMSIHRLPGRRKDGTRTTAEYHVPPISSLNIARVGKAIDRLWQEQPEIFKLRPDLEGRYSRNRAV